MTPQWTESYGNGQKADIRLPAFIVDEGPGPLRFLKETKPGRLPGGQRQPSEDPDPEVSDGEPFIRCRECLFPVTRDEDRISVNGAHSHTFANPAGIVYTIGCFSTADGCGAVGPSSGEFTWFSGHRWRVAICRKCMSHLGWHFTSGSAGFWGLILDHLIFPSTG